MAYTLDPSTGIYIDPVNGATSMDPLGQQAVTNPSLIQQAKRNLAVSHGLLDQLGKYGAQFDQSITGEQALSRHLNDVIAGNAPSVAGAQLQQGLGQIRQQADSQASGASGTNAGLARLQAIQTGGDAAAGVNQQMALVRAQEIADATRNSGAVLGNMASQSAGMYGTNVGGAAQFSGQAGNEAEAQAKIDAEKEMANRRLIMNLVAAGGATAATLATGGAAAPLAAAGLSGLAAGQAGNAAANGAGDVTAGLPSTVPSTGATNEDLLGTTSALSSYPSAAETHAMVGGLTPLSDADKSNLVNTATGLSASGAYTSDEREKTDIKKAPMEQFMDSLSGFTYEGKPGSDIPPGKRMSPMAQDVQQGGPIGKSLVIEGTPMKMDIVNTVGATLSAVKYLNDQIRELRARR
jgi:hypothetical protein